MKQDIIDDAKAAGFENFIATEINADGVFLKLLTKFAELTKARAIPDGYVLVPIEPSEAMLKAAQLEQGDHGSYSDWVDFGDAHDVEATYTAMINAQQERN